MPNKLVNKAFTRQNQAERLPVTESERKAIDKSNWTHKKRHFHTTFDQKKQTIGKQPFYVKYKFASKRKHIFLFLLAFNYFISIIFRRRYQLAFIFEFKIKNYTL